MSSPEIVSSAPQSVPATESEALKAALAGVSSAFASLGRVFFCLDSAFNVLHASSHLDRMLGAGAAGQVEGRPLESVLGADLFGPAGVLRRLLLAGERREGWRSTLAIPGSTPRPVSVTAAPFCPEPGAVCDPRVAFVVVLRPVEEDRYAGSPRFPGLIGRSAAMERIFNLIENLEHSEATVLLTGDSGTGKEVVARAIHTHSPRRDGPLVAVNCGYAARSPAPGLSPKPTVHIVGHADRPREEKTSRSVSGLFVRPACIAGVLISFPNFRARWLRTKL